MQFCGLMTEYNFLFYVIDGQKIWHTKALIIFKKIVVFVKKGGFILEHHGYRVCDVVFYPPNPLLNLQQGFEPVMLLESSRNLEKPFLRASSYFSETQDPDPSLLEIKFKEPVLNIADNAST